MDEPIVVDENELTDQMMDVEFKLVSTVFYALFYAELIEKFASRNNKDMVDMLVSQRDLVQKLASRFSKRFKELDTVVKLRQQVNNSTPN